MKYLIFFLSFSAMAFTDPVGTPTQREDGSALGLSEIKQINIYCGSVIGDYQFPAQTETNITLPETTVTLVLPNGVSYCVYTTTDIDDRESLYSNVATYELNAKHKPNPPNVPNGHRVKIKITIPMVDQ